MFHGYVVFKLSFFYLLLGFFHFSEFLLKPLPVQGAGDGESEGEGYPDAQDTHAERESRGYSP